MLFGLAQREFFKILFMFASLPSRGRLLFSGGEKLSLIINFYVRLFLIAVGIAPTIKPTTSEINPFKSAMCFMLSKRYVIGSASSLIAHPGIK